MLHIGRRFVRFVQQLEVVSRGDNILMSAQLAKCSNALLYYRRVPITRVRCLATVADGNSSQAAHEQDARCHGDDIRGVLAAAESAAHSARPQRSRDEMALLSSDVPHHTRGGNELHDLQSISLRLDE